MKHACNYDLESRKLLCPWALGFRDFGENKDPWEEGNLKKIALSFSFYCASPAQAELLEFVAFNNLGLAHRGKLRSGEGPSSPPCSSTGMKSGLL